MMAESGALKYSSQQTSTPPSRRRKRRWPRILLWSFFAFAALLLLAAGAGVLWLRSSAMTALPVLDGDQHLAGLSAPVIVRRDAHGVPHIDAATQDDLFVAQGYITAQDRLWQMDAFRRDANGELAEILGPSLVKHDLARRVVRVPQHRPPHLCQPARGRPRPLRCLCPRRKSLHQHPSGHAPAGIQASPLPSPALDRRRLRLNRRIDGRDPGHALGCKDSRASRSRPGCTIPSWNPISTPSAHGAIIRRPVFWST